MQTYIYRDITVLETEVTVGTVAETQTTTKRRTSREQAFET